eukprot:UN08141
MKKEWKCICLSGSFRNDIMEISVIIRLLIIFCCCKKSIIHITPNALQFEN